MRVDLKNKESNLNLIKKFREELDTNQQINFAHELLDDTPYKTRDYFKYSDFDENKIQHIKFFDNKPVCLLDSYEILGDAENSIYNNLKNRHSRRNYLNCESVTLQELTNLLISIAGKKNFQKGIYEQKEYPVRMSNSQGGLNHQDIYIFIKNVEGMDEGIYYYDFLNNSLIILETGSTNLLLKEIAHLNEYVIDANFTIIFVSNMNRVSDKYGTRSYRFSHVDIGIMAGYAQLYAESLGIKSVMLAGFLEHEVISVLNLDENEIPILAMSFGKIQ